MVFINIIPVGGNGTVIRREYLDNATCYDIKKSLVDVLLVPTKFMHIVYNEHNIVENDVISEIGITSDDTVHVIARHFTRDFLTMTRRDYIRNIDYNVPWTEVRDAYVQDGLGWVLGEMVCMEYDMQFKHNEKNLDEQKYIMLLEDMIVYNIQTLNNINIGQRIMTMYHNIPFSI